MKTFRELCEGKVWKAIQFMIDGLKEQSERIDFRIDMSTFGSKEDDICFGCAATCATQKATGINLTPESILHPWSIFDISKEDTDEFELAIDYLRSGITRHIFKYFGKEVVPQVGLQYLMTETWEKHLPAYQAYADQLKALDI